MPCQVKSDERTAAPARSASPSDISPHSPLVDRFAPPGTHRHRTTPLRHPILLRCLSLARAGLAGARVHLECCRCATSLRSSHIEPHVCDGSQQGPSCSHAWGVIRCILAHAFAAAAAAGGRAAVAARKRAQVARGRAPPAWWRAAALRDG
eukprot:COSAG01_NODE_2366_length_7816_cov_3.797460_14_plen_151_part_00